jgi:phosphoglycerol transferase MdoB-like AlkP superfamily enzyme
MENAPSTFMEFLKLLGSPLFIGIIVSVILVKWQWFNSLGAKLKFWLTGLVCVGLPILSGVAVEYMTPAVLAFAEHWYPFLVIGMGVWASATGWNKLFGIKGAVSKDTTVADAVKAQKAKG